MSSQDKTRQLPLKLPYVSVVVAPNERSAGNNEARPSKLSAKHQEASGRVVSLEDKSRDANRAYITSQLKKLGF